MIVKLVVFKSWIFNLEISDDFMQPKYLQKQQWWCVLNTKNSTAFKCTFSALCKEPGAGIDQFGKSMYESAHFIVLLILGYPVFVLRSITRGQLNRQWFADSCSADKITDKISVQNFFSMPRVCAFSMHRGQITYPLSNQNCPVVLSIRFRINKLLH